MVGAGRLLGSGYRPYFLLSTCCKVAGCVRDAAVRGASEAAFTEREPSLCGGKGNKGTVEGALKSIDGVYVEELGT